MSPDPFTDPKYKAAVEDERRIAQLRNAQRKAVDDLIRFADWAKDKNLFGRFGWTGPRGGEVMVSVFDEMARLCRAVVEAADADPPTRPRSRGGRRRKDEGSADEALAKLYKTNRAALAWSLKRAAKSIGFSESAVKSGKDSVWRATRKERAEARLDLQRQTRKRGHF